MSWLRLERGCELQVPGAPPKLSDVPSVPGLAEQPLLGDRFAVRPLGVAPPLPDSQKNCPECLHASRCLGQNFSCLKWG